MVRKITAVGDRMLSALLPTAKAKADNCWNVIPSSKCHPPTYENCCHYTAINRTYCQCLLD